MLPGLSVTIIVALVLPAAGWIFISAFTHRRRMRQLQVQDVPMPPWSWVLGHMPLLLQSTRKLPTHANVNLVLKEIASDFTDDGMYLLDLWPFDDPMLVIFNADAATRICQELGLPKARKNETMIRPITGGPTLLSINGQAWKTWRSLLNPGFSTGALTERIPHIIDSVSQFCDALKSNAGKGIIHLDEFTTKFTFGIITKMVIDVDVDVSYNTHTFVQAMNKIIKWHSFWDPRIMLNPLRPFAQWYYGHVINRWVENILQERNQAIRKGPADAKLGKARSIVDRAIEAATSSDGNYANDERLDPSLVKQVCHHVRLFLFVGNDSTANTIVFAHYMLWKHPDVAEKLRDEHDRILGNDPSTAATRLKDNPSLLNQCTYTQAVIKETLRLYPPAASMRLGAPGIPLPTGRGVTVATEGLSLLISHTALHSNPRLWPRVSEFLPDRWLVGPDHELHPKPGAWRAFELGQRNCIGQTLANMEIKLTLIMTARTFAIEPAYEEFDVLQQKDEGWIKKGFRPFLGGNVSDNMYNGDRVYQTEKAGAHPSEGYPCRITRR